MFSYQILSSSLLQTVLESLECFRILPHKITPGPGRYNKSEKVLEDILNLE